MPPCQTHGLNPSFIFHVQIHHKTSSTENDVYSGDHYSGNDDYSGLNPPDDAILFTVSGITVIADKKFGDFDKNAASKSADFASQWAYL